MVVVAKPNGKKRCVQSVALCYSGVNVLQAPASLDFTVDLYRILHARTYARKHAAALRYELHLKSNG